MGKFRFSFRVMGTGFRSQHLVEDSQKEIDPKTGKLFAIQANKHSQDFALFKFDFDFAFALSSWAALELRLPLKLTIVRVDFLDVDGRAIDSYGSVHHRKEELFGLGDIALDGRFRVLSPKGKRGLTLDLVAGLTFPSGRIEKNPFKLGADGKRHQHVLFGSGTVDLHGAIALHYRFSALSVSAFADAQGAVYRNRHGYQRGFELSSGVGVMTGFGLKTVEFLFQTEVFHQEPATWENESARNSGRTDLIFGFGVSWSITPAWRTYIQAKVPVTLRSEGGQLKIPVAVLLGFDFITQLL